MIPLYTEKEFKDAKINDKLQLECIVCHKPFLKLKRSIQSVLRGDKGNSGNYCSKTCLSNDRKNGLDLKCSNCGKIFYRSKGDIVSVNNFCSHSCSAIYNNKGRIMSDETKNKIRKKLKKSYNKICPCCNKEFITSRKDKIFCDKNCWKNYNKLKKKNDYIKPKRKNYYIKKDSDIENRGGYREKGGRCKQYEYINIYNEKMMLNKEEIIVAEYLDKLKLKWNRNKKGFKYFDLDNKIKKFYPDFYIKNYNFYIEYKGFPYLVRAIYDTHQNILKSISKSF